jgi:endonuclease/exonuclease/phosphatase family metal-dependent hydrolase
MKTIASVVLLCLSISVWAQTEVKVMTYNLLNYGNNTSYCTTSNNNFTQKEQYFKDIVSYYKPDILGVNEVGSNTYVLGRIKDSVFNSNVGWNYEMATYSNASGGYLANMIYYNADMFGLASQHVLAQNTRDILLYRLYFKSETLAQDQDTAFLNIVLSHLKAGSGSTEKQMRQAEVNIAMNTLMSLYPAGNYLWMGDFNIYKSSEAAFQLMVNPSNSAYAFKDPINELGSWNNNSSFKSVHTQSTHTSSNGCASGGGLDDRFDMILMSSDVLYGNEHYSYKSNSYKIPGNDGNHFDSSITSGSNNSAPASMIQTLYNMSDHLPVYLTLEVDQTVGITQAQDLDVEVRMPNPIRDLLNIQLTSHQSTELNLRVVNTLGQVMVNDLLQVNRGAQDFSFSSQGWPEGLYYVTLQDKHGQVLTHKVLKL